MVVRSHPTVSQLLVQPNLNKPTVSSRTPRKRATWLWTRCHDVWPLKRSTHRTNHNSIPTATYRPTSLRRTLRPLPARAIQTPTAITMVTRRTVSAMSRHLPCTPALRIILTVPGLLLGNAYVGSTESCVTAERSSWIATAKCADTRRVYALSSLVAAVQVMIPDESTRSRRWSRAGRPSTVTRGMRARPTRGMIARPLREGGDVLGHVRSGNSCLVLFVDIY